MEWDHYSFREDLKGILHFVPKSLTVITEEQLLPADEALHPPSGAQWEISRRAPRKADPSNKWERGKRWKDEGRVGQSIQRGEGEEDLAGRLGMRKRKRRAKILEEEEAGDGE